MTKEEEKPYHLRSGQVTQGEQPVCVSQLLAGGTFSLGNYRLGMGAPVVLFTLVYPPGAILECSVGCSEAPSRSV